MPPSIRHIYFRPRSFCYRACNVTSRFDTYNGCHAPTFLPRHFAAPARLCAVFLSVSFTPPAFSSRCSESAHTHAGKAPGGQVMTSMVISPTSQDIFVATHAGTAALVGRGLLYAAHAGWPRRGALQTVPSAKAPLKR